MNRKGLGALASEAAIRLARGLSGRMGSPTSRMPVGNRGQTSVSLAGDPRRRAEWMREEQAHEAIQDWARKIGADPATIGATEKSLVQYGPLGMMMARMLRGGGALKGAALQAAAGLVNLFRGHNPPRFGDPDYKKAIEIAERAGQAISPPVPPTKRFPTASESDRTEAMQEANQPEFSSLYRTPQSSNVWSFQYRYSTSTLYVRFKAPSLNADAVRTAPGAGGLISHQGTLGKTVTGKTNDPGPLYSYFDVPVRVFNRLVRAHSAGKAVWDNLRIRGTVWGHQFRYALAEGANVPGEGGRAGLYVPRRATKKGFRSRAAVPGGTGRRAYAMSTLPQEIRPHRGRPDRGRGWQDRHYRGR